MKVLGIGNAIIDVICKVEDNFIKKNNLIKGTMKLINKDELDRLLDKLKIEKTVSGGSVANSIVGLSQLGNEVGFIGKVSDDRFGSKYEEGLIRENVKYYYKKKKKRNDSDRHVFNISYAGLERTMCTYLGTAGSISKSDIDINAVKKSKIVLLEGYLWDKGDPKTAFDLAIEYSSITAMSLSDIFCVERHKKDFLNLVKSKLDIVFANEQEIKSLSNANSFQDIINFSKQIKKMFVITRGENGALLIFGEEIIECKAKKDLNIVDLTGAGDLFAAGFLHGYINGLSFSKCLENGNELSSKIIQKIGARLD